MLIGECPILLIGECPILLIVAQLPATRKAKHVISCYAAGPDRGSFRARLEIDIAPVIRQSASRPAGSSRARDAKNRQLAFRLAPKPSSRSGGRRAQQWRGPRASADRENSGCITSSMRARKRLRKLSGAKRSTLARQMEGEIRHSSRQNSSTALLAASTLCSANRTPVGFSDDGVTMSAAPPRANATTGVPAACASANTIPKSSYAAKTKARAF